MRFLAICGSLRAASTNAILLEAFVCHAPDGVVVEIFDGMAALPLFNPDLDEGDRPPAVTGLTRCVGEADGLIIASPEYAHGIPGPLKNALDWLVSGFEIPNKPVMLVHASMRSSLVREHLSEVLRTMSARLYPGSAFEIHLVGKTPVEARNAADMPATRDRIRQALCDFVGFVARNAPSGQG